MNHNEATSPAASKKCWHQPAVTVLEFDVTAIGPNGAPCDAGCCCCFYTLS